MSKQIKGIVILFLCFWTQYSSAQYNTCEGVISTDNMSTSSSPKTRIGDGVAGSQVKLCMNVNNLEFCGGGNPNTDLIYIYNSNGTLLTAFTSSTASGACYTLTLATGYADVWFYNATNNNCTSGGSADISWTSVNSCGENLCNVVPSITLGSGGSGTGTSTLCAASFYDPGGCSANYSNNQSYVKTFCPSTAESCTKITFNTFSLQSSTNCASDYVKIYDGNSTSEPLIGTYCGTTIPSVIQPTVNNTSGCITIEFSSNGSTTAAGWDADITCGTCPIYCPDNACPQGTSCNIATNSCEPDCDTSGGGAAPANNCISSAELITDCGVSFYTCNYSATADCSGGHCGGTKGKDYNQNLDCNNSTGTDGNDVGYSVENDIYYKFCPTATGAWTLSIEPSDCDQTSYGYQYAIFQGTESNLTLVAGGNAGQNILGPITVNFTVPSTTDCMFLQIDGYGGTKCVFAVNVGPDDPSVGCALYTQGVDICSGETATLTATGSASGSTYNWYDSSSGGTLLYTGNPYTTPVLTATTSYWVAEYKNGVEGPRGEVVATVFPAPAASTATVAESCDGLCDGQASLTMTDGYSPYTYSWSNGSTTEDLSSLCSGNYTVTITDANSCSATEVVTVDQGNAVTVTLQTVTDQCITGNSFSFDASASSPNAAGGGTFTWNYGDGNTTGPVSGAGVDNQTHSYAAAGSYTVAVTVSDGTCSDNTTITLNVDASPLVTLTPTDISCNGLSNGEITATISGGETSLSYLWSNGATTQNITGLGVGTYTISITSGLCMVTASESISTPSSLSVTALSTTITCNNGADGAIDITPGGGSGVYTYTWSNGATTQDVSALSSGTYTVSIDDGNCMITSSTILSNPAAMVVNSTITDAACGLTNGGIEISPSGAGTSYTFVWSNAATTQNVTGLGAGTFRVTITSDKGCESINTFAVTNPSPSITVTFGNDVTCFGGSDGAASVAATGGLTPYTYLWDNSETTISVSNLTAGVHFVSVIDATPCVGIEQVTIAEPSAFVITNVKSNVSCFGQSNGAIDITVSGNTSPYTFSWSNTSTTEDISGLTAQNYTVSISDVNNCTATLVTYTITEPAALTLSEVSVNNVLCSGGLTGSAQVIATGGTAPYNYTWSNGQNSAASTGMTAGVYIASVTDSKSCLETLQITITQPTVLTGSIACVAVTTNGGSDGSVSASVSGGTTDYIYTWSVSGATTSSITGLSAGLVNATITDANGCSVTDVCTITEPFCNLTMSVAVTPTSCFGGNDGQAIATTTGGSVYTYTWSSSANNTDTETGLTASTAYSVSVVDMYACEAIQSFTITEPQNITVSTSITSQPLCNGSSDGIASVLTSGGTSPYTYLWQNGETNSVASSLYDGSFNVSVYDANLCSITTTVSLTEPTPLNSTITPVDVLCNGNATGEATAAVSGGTTPYTYSWAGGTSSNTVSGLMAGNYNLTITDNNNCTDIKTYTITQPTAIILSTTTTFADCNGGTNGTATAIASGGITPYTYSWSNGLTTQIATGFMAGTHPVTVKDNNLCEKIVNALVSNPFPLTTITASTSVTCNGGSNGTANVTASGGASPYTFQWDGQTNTTGVISGLSAGMNNITVYDNSNCLAITVVDIAEPQALTITPAINNVSCNGLSDGSIDVVLTGGTSPYSYTWGGGATTSGISGLIANTYSLEIIDNNGCDQYGNPSISSCFEIEALLADACGSPEDDNEMIRFQVGPNPLDAANLTVTWPNLSWNNMCQNANTASIVSNINSTILAGGQLIEPMTMIPAYAHVIIISSDNFDWQSHDWSGLDYDLYVIFQCDGGRTTAHFKNYDTSCGTCGDPRTTTVDFGGGCSDVVSYIPNQLSGLGDGDGVEFSADGTPTYVNTGCTAPVQKVIDPILLTVTEPLVISVTPISVNDISCFGNSDGQATISASGGTSPYTYLWQAGETTTSASALIKGINNFTVTDARGCTITDAVTITEPLAITISTTVTDVFCNGQATGVIETNVTGGTSPYIYVWSNSQGTSNISGLIQGIYTLDIYDSNTCSDYTSVTITEPSALTISASPTNISCFGNSDGGITITSSGGITPYSYLWNDGSTTSTLMNVTAGMYDVTISDSNNCMEYVSVTLTQPADITTTESSTDEQCGASDGSASVTVTGGAGMPYSYLWSTGAITSSSTGISSGKHYVTITDAGNCSYIDSVQVMAAGVLTVSTASVNVSCFGGSDGSVSITPLSGISPYTYSWSGGQTTASINGLGAASYSVTISDASGCTTMTSQTINEPSALALNVTAIDVLCYSGSDGSATVVVSNGTSPYSYNWSNTQNTSTASNLTTGAYQVTVTDNNGCIETGSVTVNEPSQLLLTVSAQSDANCYGESSGTASLSTSGGTVPYTYIWSNNLTTASSSSLGAGNYSVTVSDQNNCMETGTLTIAEPVQLFFGSISTTNASCKGLTDGSVEVTINGGNTPYTYTWSNSSSDTLLNNVSAGTYGVTVTDNLGCVLDSAGIVVDEYNAIADFSWTADSYVVPAEVVFTNLSSGADYYVWDFGNGFSSDGFSPTYIFEEAGSYDVILTAYVDSNKLCNDTAKHIIVIEEQPSYQIPNVFSPNGDDQNDIFNINGINIAQVEGIIYNRWGNELFKWETMQGGWDGRTYAGEEVPEGTYFYIIKVKEVEGENWLEPFTGTVTLVR